MADLRGFTTLADTAGRDLIERLDEHLDAMAAPVLAQGGHVLKFLGDGLLAAFPISDGLPRADACRQALAAAREALVLNDRVNRARPDEPELGLDVAIHAGEVFYGNVGAAARLDFTVIGPAVNELSRMEALCSHLGRSIVISAEVAAEIPETVIPLGRFQLRGVEAERELFAVRSLSTAKTA